MSSYLLYKAEYAKNGRGFCKKCKEIIKQDTLRLAIFVQSPVFDGKIAHWYHLKCFFEQTTLHNVGDMANFSNLLCEDQENIRKRITETSNLFETNCNFPVESAIPCVPEAISEITIDDGKSWISEVFKSESEFSVEYAKSSRNSCISCCEKIARGKVRISKLDKDVSEWTKDDILPVWYHVDCFIKVREELHYNEAADKLSGFSLLKKEDQEDLKARIRTQGIKRKAESVSSFQPSNSKKEFSKLKVQNEELFMMQNSLSINLKKKDMITLLEYNNQHIPTNYTEIIDNLSDCMLFGALKECPDCKNARPRFLHNAYVCPGHLTEWTKCQYVTKYPEREKFAVPEEFKEEFEFLKNYKCIVQERYLLEVPEPNMNKKFLPLKGFKIGFIGRLYNQNLLEKQLQELGATVEIDTCFVDLYLSTKEDFQWGFCSLMQGLLPDIHVVSTDFVQDVREGSPVAFSVKKHLLSTWSGDPILKFGIKQENKKRQKEEFNASVLKRCPQKMKLSKADAVDPESGLENTCHVYREKDAVYNVILAYVDISKGTNSFHKMQLLESNNQENYYLFQQWGRVGTQVGSKKVNRFNGVEFAINEFERMYLEKTLNKWWDRKHFVKKPGGMYPLDIDYEQDDSVSQDLKPGTSSKLSMSVQELICLIFDIQEMKKTMAEFEIDMQKMPLGKLSKTQIEMASKVLSEAQQILVTGCNSAKISDVTNRFFTLIPHNFGVKGPPLLDNEEIIKSKVEMVDSLMEIEFAYNLVKSKRGASNKEIDKIYEYYKTLKTDITVLEKGSEDYKLIATYFMNAQHGTMLSIEEVFKINRHGEEQRYKEHYKSLHNKKLLWHGSKTTNFVGILSQGLRIAPPEAPFTGSMFGKGVYFADMVSKSSGYCRPTSQDSSMLLLLSEVALGNMYEKLQAEPIRLLPEGKHSTFGMGRIGPNPKQIAFMGGVEVPTGKPMSTGINGALNYNEYIVYDVKQINIKYLLKVSHKNHSLF